MPAQKRFQTDYPGVYYIVGKAIANGKPEKIYYIDYRKDGKRIQEKAGRQFQDDMSPARASRIRASRIEGRELPNVERRAAKQAERDAEAGRWTVDRLWDEYKKMNPDLKGIVTDKNRYANHIKPVLGKKELKDIAPLDVDRLRIKLQKKISAGTVKNVLELFRRIANFSVKKNLCPGLTFTIQMPDVNNLKTEDLSADELTRLLKAIESDSNIQAANLMKMALYTGMRRSELFKLKWDHVDFERGFILIVNPKGGVDQKIPLNDAARELLNNHPKTGSEFIFPGRGGRQRTDIKKQVNRIKRAAGLPADFRALHGLRHVYASMLASSGKVDMYTLQRLLTHKSPVMTQRYAHLRDDTLKRAANVAGDIIGGIVNGTDKADVVNTGDRDK